jgi:hypothetical protein
LRDRPPLLLDTGYVRFGSVAAAPAASNHGPDARHEMSVNDSKQTFGGDGDSGANMTPYGAKGRQHTPE